VKLWNGNCFTSATKAHGTARMNLNQGKKKKDEKV
jgi:hypothetical protein